MMMYEYETNDRTSPIFQRKIERLKAEFMAETPEGNRDNCATRRAAPVTSKPVGNQKPAATNKQDLDKKPAVERKRSTLWKLFDEVKEMNLDNVRKCEEDIHKFEGRIAQNYKDINALVLTDRNGNYNAIQGLKAEIKDLEQRIAKLKEIRDRCKKQAG